MKSSETKKRRSSGSISDDVKKAKRPISVVRGIIEFPLEQVKEHLTCKLCQGYLREAYTISECLHSFCKSCLFCEYNLGCTKCPECLINLGPDPYPVTIYDRTLQELVDSILPDLRMADQREEREYYKRNNIKPKKDFESDIAKEGEEADGGESTAGKSTARLTRQSAGCQFSPGNRTRSKSSTEDVPTDELNFELQPYTLGKEKSLSPLNKSLARVSGRLKIFQLKKFLASQLELSLPEIEVRCNGDTVGDELSLTFIQRTRWLTNDDLVLTYGMMDADA